MASTDGGLMQHVEQKRGGQVLLEDSAGQLRWLSRQACVHCGTIRSQRCRRCNSCGFDTLLCELCVGDTFQDRRQPGHQDAAASSTAAGQHLPQNSQPVPGEPLDDSPLPNCAIRDIVLTDCDKQLLSELRRASAMALPRFVVSRYATAWAESLEGAMSGHQSWALLCRYRCRLLLAEIPEGVDRNSDLKQLLQPWESGQVSILKGKVLGQQNSGQRRRKAGKKRFFGNPRAATDSSQTPYQGTLHSLAVPGVLRWCRWRLLFYPNITESMSLQHVSFARIARSNRSLHQRSVFAKQPAMIPSRD